MSNNSLTDKVGAGLIGCGAISKAHLEAMQKGGLRILGLCDLVEERAQQRKEELKLTEAKIYTDYRNMLEDSAIQIVGIASPPFAHREQVVQSLLAGKYVYCEKPVCFRLKEFDEIFSAEQRSGKRAFFTTARFRKREGKILHDYVSRGLVGSIYRVQSRHFRTRGRPGVDILTEARWFADHRKAITGITGDMGMYFMDRSLFLTNWEKVVSVSAMIYKEFEASLPKDVVYDVEEHVVIFARTQGKLVYTFEFANIAHHPSLTDVMILGKEGGVFFDSNQNPPLFYQTERGEPWHVVKEIPQWDDRQTWDEWIYQTLGKLVKGESVDVNQLGTTSEQVYHLHEIMQMAFTSAQERREVRRDELDRNKPIFAGIQ